MALVERLLEAPAVYRLWQSGFADAKLRPVLAHNDLGRAGRVLDVACGPGTNTRHFGAADYLGIDLNPRYVEYARRRHNREFLVCDVTAGLPTLGRRFDFILVNSFFHHVDDTDTVRILAELAGLLADGGTMHILDLVLPERASVALLLAHLDRGRYARPLAAWQRLFAARLDPLHCEPYPLTLLGTTLWHMVYFKGRARG